MTNPFAPAWTAELSAWLKGRFIPRWVERTCRPDLRGYIEAFDPTRQEQPLPGEHTTMVTGRLVYTFSMAHRFDGAPETLRAAEHGLAFLLDACRVSHGHFARRLGADGRVIDPHAGLYDLAFVLLALGGYGAATGKTDALTVAEEVAARLDGDWLDPAGGYRELAGTVLPRLQYPQMHLFEAFQMLAAVNPDGGWLARAERIVDLAARLVDEHGAIDEGFGPFWDTLEPDKRHRELGHHFEWAWLLFVHAAQTGSPRAADLAWRLFDFAVGAAGIPTSGPDRTIPNAIDALGNLTSPTRPLWPTIELAKAALAAATLDRRNDRLALAARSLEVMLTQFNRETALWVNEADGADLPPPHSPTPLPVRTLYHIVPALIFFANSARSGDETGKITVLRPF